MPVEDLNVGDRVQTLDNGVKILRWIGKTDVDFHQGAGLHAGKHRPIEFKAGALGAGVPRHCLRVSPQHRMLLAGLEVETAFGTSQVLAMAKALVGLPGVRVMQGARRTVYYSLLFDAHQIVFANGAPSESFRPGPVVLAGFSPQARQQVLEIYPGLADGAASKLAPLARRCLKRREIDCFVASMDVPAQIALVSG